LARGADAVRTGLEDNIRISKSRLAASNAELVTLAASAIARQRVRLLVNSSLSANPEQTTGEKR
jgi:3-keto-5-aminohexanoate cleavage enzyme